jgi:hypothetical protein
MLLAPVVRAKVPPPPARLRTAVEPEDLLGGLRAASSLASGATTVRLADVEPAHIVAALSPGTPGVLVMSCEA